MQYNVDHSILKMFINKIFKHFVKLIGQKMMYFLQNRVWLGLKHLFELKEKTIAVTVLWLSIMSYLSLCLPHRIKDNRMEKRSSIFVFISK